VFFDILSALCAKKGISAYKACTDMGLNRSAVAKWKNGSTPNGATISKMADYFGVTTDYLLGTDPEDTPVTEEAKELEIEEYIEQQKRFLESQPGLMFNGYPASKEAIDSLLHALELGKRAAMSVSEEEKRRAAEIKRRILDEDDDCEDLI